MKENFLALTQEVKSTGIVAILSNASNVEAFKDAWQKFSDENPELFKKAFDWGAEFKTDVDPFFEDGEAIENPMEVVVAIRIAGNEVSECDVFENYADLVRALKDLGTPFANAVAECIDGNYIYDIKVEGIFAAIEDLAEPDDGNDNGEVEPDDGNDNGEVEPDDGNDNGEAEPDDGNDKGEAEPDDGNENGEAEPDDGNDNGEAEPDDGNDKGEAEPDDGNDNGEAEPDDGNDNGEAEPDDGNENGEAEPGDDDYDGEAEPEGE